MLRKVAFVRHYNHGPFLTCATFEGSKIDVFSIKTCRCTACFAPSYIRNRSKPDAEIVHFMISDTCFAPKLYKHSLKTGCANRSFSSFSTRASHQSYIRNRSKPGSEIVHFRHFRHLFRTEAIEGIAQNRVRKSFIFIILRYLFRTKAI